MEVFWMVIGVLILAFSTYSYINQEATKNLFEMTIAGAMAILLSVFRIMYRKQTYKNQKNIDGK